MQVYNALIRTHHITSRKKVAVLKRAAVTHQCSVLLRSGGCPGIMYVEGRGQERVEMWVDVVRRLRYKDFQLVTRTGALEMEENSDLDGELDGDLNGGKKGKGNRKNNETEQEVPGLALGLEEVESVKEFGSIMAERGVWKWWRKGMGYT